MNYVMTMDEINSRFESEWILIADPEIGEHHEVIRGRVVCHSKDRDGVDREAIELRLKHSAFHYTGAMPENMAISVWIPGGIGD